MPQSTHRTPGTKKLSSQNAKFLRSFLLVQEFAAREIGDRIAKARREAGGMTQEQLADLVDVSERSIQNYEAGVSIPYKHLHRIAEVLNRSVGWFLHGEPTPAEGSEDGRDGPEVVRRLAALEEREERTQELLLEVLRLVRGDSDEQARPG